VKTWQQGCKPIASFGSRELRFRVKNQIVVAVPAFDHRGYLVRFHVDCVEEFVVGVDVDVCPSFEGNE
jgi:hypothetical protein